MKPDTRNYGKNDPRFRASFQAGGAVALAQPPGTAPSGGAVAGGLEGAGQAGGPGPQMSTAPPPERPFVAGSRSFQPGSRSFVAGSRSFQPGSRSYQP